MVVRTCSEIGLPAAIYIRMIFNIVLDFLVGLVPFLGDLADAAYKANTRNAIILENYLRGRGVENLRQQGMPLPTDYSLPEEWEQQQGLQQQGGAAPGPSGVSGAGSSSRRDRREADVEAQRGGSKKSTKVSEVSRPTQAPTNSKSSKSKSSSRR